MRDWYAGLPASVLLEPGVTKAWSVKDIVAHVTTWEEEALKHLPAVLEGRKPPRYSVIYGGIDAFNALMTTKKANLSLATVLEQQEQVHRRVGEHRRTRARGCIGPPKPDSAGVFASIHTGHYPKHTAAIRRWQSVA